LNTTGGCAGCAGGSGGRTGREKQAEKKNDREAKRSEHHSCIKVFVCTEKAYHEGKPVVNEGIDEERASA
jgi:hypothetical protein